MATTERPRLIDYVTAPLHLIPRLEMWKRSTFYTLFWGGLTIATGVGALAGFTHLASEADAAAYRASQPLPVVHIDQATNPQPASDAPAPGVDPAALPDLSAAFDGAVFEAVAPAPVAEVVPDGNAESITVEYVGESNGAAAAVEAPAPVEAAPATDGIDYYYSLDGYASTLSQGQAMIDACTGGVTEMGSYTANGAPRTFALHSHCGGDAVTYAPEGSTVAIGGSVYTLGPIVARLSAFEHTDLDIPTGYDAMWQSCYNGAADMAFRSLTLVG
ncbi:hypothetical protein [Pseudoclavibacter helvolus]|uniref:hypothetical protein n=1 Tax=Pseudoclavibacter helvolus TaxID=255205 RepID=UPI003C7443A9